MSATIVELIGMPGAGKTELCAEICKGLREKNKKIFEINSENVDPLELRVKYKSLLSTLIRGGIVFLILLSSLPYFFRWGNGTNGRGWISWVRRVSREWFDCVVYRKFVQNISEDYDFIVCDSKFSGKYIYEIADPRNVVGINMLGVFMCGLRCSPKIPIRHMVILQVDPRVAYQRVKGRTFNQVRKELSDGYTEIFFEKAHQLSRTLFDGELKKYADNISLTDTSGKTAFENRKCILALLSD